MRGSSTIDIQYLIIDHNYAIIANANSEIVGATTRARPRRYATGLQNLNDLPAPLLTTIVASRIFRYKGGAGSHENSAPAEARARAAGTVRAILWENVEDQRCLHSGGLPPLALPPLSLRLIVIMPCVVGLFP
jgi:hypothetical protein